MKKPRWAFDWPIPKSVQLPGVRVRVQVGPRKFNCDGAWVYDYRADYAVICIDAALPLEVQRYTLLHELQHTMVDLLDQAIERSPELVKTKHMAGYTPEKVGEDASGIPGSQAK